MKQTRGEAIRDFLAEHEGGHRGTDVAKALGITTHQALVALIYEFRQDRIARTKNGTYHLYHSKEQA